MGLSPVGAGTLWNLTLRNPGQGERQVPVLVLDYNAGNGMAITVEVALGEPRPGSPVVVPITIQDTGADNARVNIVRAIPPILSAFPTRPGWSSPYSTQNFGSAGRKAGLEEIGHGVE